jgi:hypothetical protein
MAWNSTLPIRAAARRSWPLDTLYAPKKLKNKFDDVFKT